MPPAGKCVFVPPAAAASTEEERPPPPDTFFQSLPFISYTPPDAEGHVECPAEGCQHAPFALDVGLAPEAARHKRSLAIATHMRCAIAGHSAGCPGICSERLAAAQLMWCCFCGKAQAATAPKAGY